MHHRRLLIGITQQEMYFYFGLSEISRGNGQVEIVLLIILRLYFVPMRS